MFVNTDPDLVVDNVNDDLFFDSVNHIIPDGNIPSYAWQEQSLIIKSVREPYELTSLYSMVQRRFDKHVYNIMKFYYSVRQLLPFSKYRTSK